MNQYLTGNIIRKMREKNGLTQGELASRIGVSDKAVSRWETGRGFPDISLMEQLAKELGVSVMDLLSGQNIENHNASGNLSRAKIYICPVCGNVIISVGEATHVCCGIQLCPAEFEQEDDDHRFVLEKVEDECFISINHPMTKVHYISFVAWITGDGFILKKLYPEQNAECRIKIRGRGILCAYCNRHGLYCKKM